MLHKYVKMILVESLFCIQSTAAMDLLPPLSDNQLTSTIFKVVILLFEVIIFQML